MCEAVPYPGTELYDYVKELDLGTFEELESVP